MTFFTTSDNVDSCKSCLCRLWPGEEPSHTQSPGDAPADSAFGQLDAEPAIGLLRRLIIAFTAGATSSASAVHSFVRALQPDSGPVASPHQGQPRASALGPGAYFVSHALSDHTPATAHSSAPAAQSAPARPAPQGVHSPPMVLRWGLEGATQSTPDAPHLPRTSTADLQNATWADLVRQPHHRSPQLGSRRAGGIAPDPQGSAASSDAQQAGVPPIPPASTHAAAGQVMGFPRLSRGDLTGRGSGHDPGRGGGRRPRMGRGFAHSEQGARRSQTRAAPVPEAFELCEAAFPQLPAVPQMGPTARHRCLAKVCFTCPLVAHRIRLQG